MATSPPPQPVPPPTAGLCCLMTLSLQYSKSAFSALTLLVGRQEEHAVCKN